MFVKVLVELSAFNIDKTFTYHVPFDMQKDIKVGIRVLVPFNSQELEGFLLEILDYTSIDAKDIIKIIDTEPILTKELLLLGRKISDETLSTLISSYQVMLPRALKARNKNHINIKYQQIVEIDNLNIILTSKQQEIIDKINEKGRCLYSELKKINSSVDTLLKKGILVKKNVEEYRLNIKNNKIYPRHELNEDQKMVFEEVKNNLNHNVNYLLHGITGSGKTEVYMELMEEVIKLGKSCLLLVPEITLTNQIAERVMSRFNKVAILHSALSDGEKYDEYRKIKRGEVDVVIGARSAVFAPLSNIGIIIIDECHTTSYYQDNMPRYDAIDVAKERCLYHSCPLVLGSATPTIDMYARASKNIYKLLTLSKRAGLSIPPKVTICDMTKEKKVHNTFLSGTLVNKIRERLDRHEQVILLQNRRGYSSTIMCTNCGYTMKCPNCDITLTYHKNKDIMRCHYCGYAKRKIDVCPHCSCKDIKELGLGTEKVEEDLQNIFSKVRIVRMDYDTTSKRGSHEKILSSFANYEYDILLGTQMIAKGLDFDKVTLVGVISCDNSLFMPTYRSSEDTYNLLNQVSGRSGRRNIQGEVVIQTYNPDHYAITLSCNNDYKSFYQREMMERKKGEYPPYYYLTEVIFKSSDYDFLSREVNKIKNILSYKLSDKKIIGPMMLYPFKVNNVNRFGIIIKYKKELDLKKVLKDLIDHIKLIIKLK